VLILTILTTAAFAFFVAWLATLPVRARRRLVLGEDVRGEDR
jgi:hypothetical protein